VAKPWKGLTLLGDVYAKQGAYGERSSVSRRVPARADGSVAPPGGSSRGLEKFAC
jgi:hypothetical protein